MALVGESCEGPRHFIENGRINRFPFQPVNSSSKIFSLHIEPDGSKISKINLARSFHCLITSFISTNYKIALVIARLSKKNKTEMDTPLHY